MAAEPGIGVAGAPGSWREASDDPSAGSTGPGTCETGPEEIDPWFGAAHSGGNSAGGPASEPARPAPADLSATQADWFLPGGRAGLLPDSVTVGEPEPGEPKERQPAPVEAAGTPPWAADTTQPSAGNPPPWENGPWPEPGAPRPSLPAAAARKRPQEPAPRRDMPSRRWTPRTVLVAGLLPLVVPGVVAGLLGLRRSRPGEQDRRASLVALAASLAWAVVISVVIAASTGGSSGGCIYPAAVHQAYSRAMADISGNAAGARLAADLAVAASRANSAAAAAGSLPVRTALFAMAADLQQARADVIARNAVPGSLRAHLAADETTLTASCPA